MLEDLYLTPQPTSPAPERFAVELRPDRARVFVAPRGELDLATAKTLETAIDQLVDDGFQRLVLDLRGVSFIDSTGIGLIVRQTRRTDARIDIIDGPDAVSRVFRLCGLDDQLPFVDARSLR